MKNAQRGKLTRRRPKESAITRDESMELPRRFPRCSDGGSTWTVSAFAITQPVLFPGIERSPRVIPNTTAQLKPVVHRVHYHHHRHQGTGLGHHLHQNKYGVVRTRIAEIHYPDHTRELQREREKWK